MATEPVGLAQNLPPQRVMRAQVGDQDLAIWRGASLTVQAWANRCPHRGMRLSYGFVRDDSLACAYHGWHYDCQATCHYIPAHPTLDPPATIKPVVFSAIEQQAVLWVSTDGEASPPRLPENCTAVRSIAFDCQLEHAKKAFYGIKIHDVTGQELIVSKYKNDPSMLVFSSAERTDSVLVLLQQSGLNTITCHLLAHTSWSVFERIKLSRWSESVRRQAEEDSR